MRTLLFILLFIACVTHQGNAQVSVSENSKLVDRLYTGGGFGLSFSNDVFSVSASPIIGCMLTERLSAGVGVPYQYTTYPQVDISTNDYGARAFGRFNVAQKFFAYTEFEYLNFEFVNITDPDNNIRQGFDSYFFGLGYSSGNPGTQFNIIGLYNITWQENTASPYNSPWAFRFQLTIPIGSIGRRGY